MTTMSPDEQLIDRLIASRTPIISINSTEEARVEASLARVAQMAGMDVWVWSQTDGMQPLSIKDKTYASPLPITPWSREPKFACDLLYILGVVRYWRDMTSKKDAQGNFTEANDRPTLFIFRDALPTLLRGGEYANDKALISARAVRDLARDLPLTEHTAVFLHAHAYIPDNIEKEVAVVDWALPTADDLSALLEQLVSSAGVSVEINGSKAALLRNLAGLTETEAVQVLSMAIAALGKIDARAIPFVLEEKKKVINAHKDVGIEYWDGLPFSAVGGCGGVKDAMRAAEARYDEKASAYGLGPGRGMVLFGLQGGGKSLSAKCFGDGKRPVIYWNPTASQSKWVGDTDKNQRKVFQLCEAVGNLTLIIDEGGKNMAGGGVGDGGVRVGQLGSLCTWMEERARRFGIYVILTTNEAEIDPALGRRFDDWFFFDLPTAEARAQVFAIHLGKRKQTLVVSESMLTATADYTPAEIEKVVEKAMTRAYADSARPLTEADVLWACQRTIPLSVQQVEVVSAMRSNAKGRMLDAETGLPYGDVDGRVLTTTAPRRVRVVGK